MPKKEKKADPALKARLEREAAERNAVKAGNSKPVKTAAERRASAERREQESLQRALKKNAEETAALMQKYADAGAEASKAAAEAAAAAAEAARNAAAARIASEKRASKKAANYLTQSRRFHAERPHHGQNPTFGEPVNILKRRGGRRTRRNRK